MPIVGFKDLAPRDNAGGSAPAPSASRASGGSSAPPTSYGASVGSSAMPSSDHPRGFFANPYIEEDPSLGISMMEPPMRADGQQPSFCQRCCPRIAMPRATTLLCFVQLIVFIITLIVGGALYDGAFVSSNSLGGPSAAALRGMGGKWEPWIRNRHEVWRLITPIFLHAGVLHLLSNLLFQIRFGYTLERRWQWWRFFLVYLLTGISASLWSAVLSPKNVSVGASGALFGLVGADITYVAYNYQYIPHAKRELIFIAIITLVTFLFGIGSSVDNYAHLGGLISGLGLGVAIPPALVKRPTEVILRLAGAILFGGLFLLFVLLLWAADPWSDATKYPQAFD